MKACRNRELQGSCPAVRRDGVVKRQRRGRIKLSEHLVQRRHQERATDLRLPQKVGQVSSDLSHPV